MVTKQPWLLLTAKEKREICEFSKTYPEKLEQNSQ